MSKVNSEMPPSQNSPQQSPRVRDIASENFWVLWQRAAKIVVPVSAVGSFVSDVLAPLGPFIAVLFGVTAALCVLTGVIWFGFKRRQIRKALVDGVIDHNEFQRISSVNSWSVAFAFNFIAAVVLSAFFFAQKVFASANPDRGAIANVFPEIADLQTRLLKLQEKAEKIEATTARLEESGERVEARTAEIKAAIDQIDEKLDSIDATVAAAQAGAGSADKAPASIDLKTCVPGPGEPDEVNPYGKVYTGTDFTVEMALYKNVNKVGLQDVLLKIKGGPAFDAGIDGLVKRYEATNGGRDGLNYEGWHNGEPITRMAMRRSAYGGGESYEVYIGTKSYPVYFDKLKSSSACAYLLLKEYKAGPP